MKKFLLFVLIICAPLTFFACSNDSLPTLDTPTGLEVSDGVISFVRVSGAEYYTFCINNDTFSVFDKSTTENSKVTLVTKAGVNYLEYDATSYFVLGESYSIKIKAEGADKYASEFSLPVTYVYTAPLTTPKSIYVNNVVLSWDLVENASSYSIKVQAPYSLETDTFVRQDNAFDFSFLLTTAGKYSFSVQAISTSELYSNSTFSAKVNYTYQVQLKQPKLGSVKNVYGELLLPCVLDDFANAIAIKTNGVTITKEVYPEADFCEFENNLMIINLNKFFKNSTVNLEENNLFTFEVKACYLTHNESDRFYIDSPFATCTLSENGQKLTTPTHTLTEGENEFTLTLDTPEKENCTGFNLFVLINEEVENVFVSLNSTFVLKKDFTCVLAAAAGVASYDSSDLIIIENPHTTQQIEQELTISETLNTVSWSQIEGAQYVVQTNNQIFISNSTSLTANSQTGNVTVFALKRNCKVKSAVLNTQTRQKLELNIEENPALKAKINFAGNENAFGYYIFIQPAGEARQKIAYLFTTTSIDLTKYLDANKTYSIFVQAVAEKYSNFDNSEIVKLGTISPDE